MARRTNRQPDDQDAGSPKPALPRRIPGRVAEGFPPERAHTAAPAEPSKLASAADPAEPQPDPALRRRPTPTIPHPRGRGMFPSAPTAKRMLMPREAGAAPMPREAGAAPVPREAGPAQREPAPVPGAGGPAVATAEPDARPGAQTGARLGPAAAADSAGRPRRLLLLCAAIVAVALLAGGTLWVLRDRAATDESPSALSLPEPMNPVGGEPAVPSAAAVLVPASAGGPSAPAKAGLPGTSQSLPTTAATPAPVTGSTTHPAANVLANPSGVNLARNRPVLASSSEGDHWGPSNAVDGSPETRWSSGFSDPQWIAVDLGALRRITEIRLSWERAYATAYRVQVSADGRTWKSVYSTSSGTGGEITISAGKVAGRYVRMYGTKRSGQYGYSLFEIDVR